MDVKLKIPFRGHHIKLFVSNLPSWFGWSIVVLWLLWLALKMGIYHL